VPLRFFDASCSTAVEFPSMYMQDATAIEEFDRDDMDAADALFALANQQHSGRNVSRKVSAGALISLLSYSH
jgi:hypothetical protein